MWHEARQVPSWLIFDVSQRKIAMRSLLEKAVGSRATRVVRFVGRAREYGFPKRKFAVSGFSVSSRDSESQMRAKLAVPPMRSKEAQSGFVQRNQAANKAPEPTPGLVTPRAMESAFEMKRRNGRPDAARGAPSPVVAHL